MTKFKVIYERVYMSALWISQAVVSLPAKTREEAGAIIQAQGGFVDELPPGVFITTGAIRQIDIMES